MKVFHTNKTESWKMKLVRSMFNFFPAYRRGGGRACFVSDDWHEVHVKVKYGILTRNYVGTTFGGSLFAALDPIFMLQLIKILGKSYVIWDKSATINFIKPVDKIVFARFLLTEQFINEIRDKVQQNGEYSIELPVSLEDKQGKIYVTMTQQIYIANKSFYSRKIADKKLVKQGVDK